MRMPQFPCLFSSSHLSLNDPVPDYYCTLLTWRSSSRLGKAGSYDIIVSTGGRKTWSLHVYCEREDLYISSTPYLIRSTKSLSTWVSWVLANQSGLHLHQSHTKYQFVKRYIHKDSLIRYDSPSLPDYTNSLDQST